MKEKEATAKGKPPSFAICLSFHPAAKLLIELFDHKIWQRITGNLGLCMIIKFKKSICLFTFLLTMDSAGNTGAELFFENTTITNFQLHAPFEKMSEAKKNPNFLEIKNKKFAGFMTYVNEQNQPVKLAVEISMKGFSSLGMCKFPKLELKLIDATGTIFKSVKKVDLNTHCDDSSEPIAPGQFDFRIGMFNAHREVLAYRILRSLGQKSFLTKPAFLTYTDSETNLRPTAAAKENYQAFFIEDKSQFIKRNSFAEVKATGDGFKQLDLASKKTTEDQYRFKSVAENSDQINVVDLATIDLFQNLISNHDWYIKADTLDSRSGSSTDQLWNMKIFEDAEKRWVPVAQDFNLSYLCFIETIPSAINSYVSKNKFIEKLDIDSKNQLRERLIAAKPEILDHLRLIQNDPQIDKLKTFLELRIELLASSLQ